MILEQILKERGSKEKNIAIFGFPMDDKNSYIG